MEPITVIMGVIGVVLLIGSCFLPEKSTPETEYDELIKRLAKRELTPEEVERLRQTVDRIVSEKTEEVILKTDDYLSRVANEKIMSVDEFSKQILERLDKNNSDVMFLYNMVTETKEELKTEIVNAKRMKEALQTEAEAVAEARREEAEPLPVKTAEPEPEPRQAKKTAVPKKTAVKAPAEKKQGAKAAPSEEITELLAVTAAAGKDAGTDVDMPKERILALHRKGKTIREISRELGMGQGEVKLVIDLYGA